MSQRILAIGDVHGCAEALRGLIELLRIRSDDTIVMLGDCVDRGPDSRGVIDFLLELADRCCVIPILGNHEEMLLTAIDRPGTTPVWLDCGGREALESYGVRSASELPREHVLYMRTWLDFWETPTHFFAHGSYAPQVPLTEQEWGFQRWESLGRQLPAPHQSGKTAVLGHTSQKDGEVLDAGHLVCIDTYCCGGRWLTAMDTATRQFWQVDPGGNPRPTG